MGWEDIWPTERDRTQNVFFREYGRTQPISAGKLEIENGNSSTVPYHVMTFDC